LTEALHLVRRGACRRVALQNAALFHHRLVDVPDSHRFAAFISYRHVEPDRAVARWLHGALETYRPPATVVGPGAPARLGRVFRDEEELGHGLARQRCSCVGRCVGRPWRETCPGLPKSSE
jgi:hypothetical protein